ncbi:MAG: nucleotidyltransferase domain-containing protein [Anaerolineales bacterium]|nr:nucleotidyltransferase domain-containing protein [Anaerolineales bacterium]
MERIIHAITKQYLRELDKDLEFAYLYGSLAQRNYDPNESDVNLLLVVSNRVSIHHMRDIFRPIWETYGRQIRRAPLIATRNTLARHMLLRPYFAHHLVHDGQSLLGGNLLDQMPPLPDLADHDAYAYLAYDALLASAALGAGMVPAEEAAADLLRLRRIARRFLGEALPPDAPATAVFGRIQDHLDPAVHALPTDQPWASDRTATSPLLPGLQTTYIRDQETMVLVFSHLSANQIDTIAWDKLAGRLAKDYRRLLVTSSVQYRLIHQFERPLDLVFRRSQPTWGLDPLADLQTTRRLQMRHAARTPADIQLDTLTNAYLTAADDEIHQVIHDYQNRLLNVRLENELLNRFGLVEKFSEPRPLPDREAPITERVDAIFQHLSWWSDYYAKKMLQAA